MPQLLLEIFSEEIPARMQGQAARDLERMARERLTEAALTFDTLRAYAGPRRLTLVVDGLPVAQDDRVERLVVRAAAGHAVQVDTAAGQRLVRVGAGRHPEDEEQLRGVGPGGLRGASEPRGFSPADMRTCSGRPDPR